MAGVVVTAAADTTTVECGVHKDPTEPMKS
jgi:hypothetical protein